MSMKAMVNTLKLLSLFAVCGLAVQNPGYAQSYPYLDDANEQPDAPTYAGRFPKVVASETQSDNGSAEAWSKYDVIGAKSGMIYKVIQAQAINPSLEFHYSFHPRSYLGYLSQDPCDIAFGMPFNSTGPSTTGCSVYAGHWLYQAGTRLTSSVDSSSRTLFVTDASHLSVGSYVVIYDAPAGSFGNAEHAKISGIDRSVNPHRVTLAARGYKSTPRPHGVNSIVAQHELGRSGARENWAYNITTTGPRDANNRTIAQVMSEWIPANMNRNSKGQVQNVDVTGVYFDEDEYFLYAQRVDANNDLVVDNAILPSGQNVWGGGLDEFYRLLRVRLPNKRLVGGWRQSRGFPSLNGTQMENWLLAGDDFAVNPVYTGNGGIYSQLHNYMIHLQYHDVAAGYTEALSKVPTRIYPGTVKSGPNPVVPSSNANMRLGLGATLLGNGHYGRQNSDHHPDPWYDEYAVDVRAGSSTYGYAIRSNHLDESQIRQHKGWLGRPLGARKRIYDSDAFRPEANMISNGGFESGTNGWVMSNVVTQIDTGNKASGNQSLRTAGHSTYTSNLGSASVKGPVINLVAGRQYTLAFAARSSEMREIFVRLDYSKHQGIYLVPTRWTRFVYTITAEKSGTFRPVFNLGREETNVWIDDVYVFEGDPNVFRRDFDNGIVVVNATPKARTVSLGGDFLRIQGTGQDAINDGSRISSVALPPFDAAILVRTQGGSSTPPPPPPSSGDVILGGRAWRDTNGDGVRGTGESGYGGVTMRLLTCGNTELARTTTAGDGTYQFANLSAGSYSIAVIRPSGTTHSPAFVGDRGDLDSNISPSTGQTSCMTVVSGNRRLAIDAGLVPESGDGPGAPGEPTPSGTIGDRVWHDVNRNGIQDASEPGLGNVTVQLRTCTGNVLQSTSSTSSGHYSFTAAPGNYELRFVAPSGMSLTSALSGSSRAADSNPNPATGLSGCLTLNAGDDRQWYDAGFVQ